MFTLITKPWLNWEDMFLFCWLNPFDFLSDTFYKLDSIRAQLTGAGSKWLQLWKWNKIWACFGSKRVADGLKGALRALRGHRPGCVFTVPMRKIPNQESSYSLHANSSEFSSSLQLRHEKSGVNPAKLQINPDNYAYFGDPVARCVYDPALFIQPAVLQSYCY